MKIQAKNTFQPKPTELSTNCIIMQKSRLKTNLIESLHASSPTRNGKLATLTQMASGFAHE